MKASASKKESSLSSPLLLLFLVALLVRGVALFISPSSFDADPDGYMALAENWYSYGVYGNRETPTAFRPPLYPAALKTLILCRVSSERPKVKSGKSNSQTEKRIIASSPNKRLNPVADFFDRNVALSRNASVALLHWILGVATALIVWFYARRAGLSPILALLAGTLVVFDPILLQQSRLVMTETAAAFFSALLLLTTTATIQKRDSKFSWFYYALVGVLFGLATLCRPAFYVFSGLVFLNLVVVEIASLVRKRRERQTDLVSALCGGALRIACFILGLALVVAPWTLRNEREFGKTILTTTHGGYTLYLANNPEIYAHYRSSFPFNLWNPESFHDRRSREIEAAIKENKIQDGTVESELFQDEWNRQKAIQTINEDRAGFYYSCLIRSCELWRFLPNDVSAFADDEQPERKKTFAGMPLSQAVDLARYAVAAFYLLEFILALLGCLALRLSLKRQSNDETIPKVSLWESPFIWGFLLVLSVQLPHLVYWTNMRMRAPLEVFIPILAVMSLTLFQNKRSCPKR